MSSLDDFIHLLDVNFINCLIPIILTFLLIEKVFKDKFPTKSALKFTSWFVVFYTTLILLQYIAIFLLEPDSMSHLYRPELQIKLFFWTHMLLATILPFTLLYKDLSSKYWYVILVVFLMKFGVNYELFVILTTSFHRDFLPQKWDLESFGVHTLFLIVLQGVIISVAFLYILKYSIKKRPESTI